MASIKYKTSEGYTSIPMNIIGSRIYLEDYDDGEVIPELVDDSAKLGNGIGICSTSTGTALEVTLANYKLVKNGIVAVTFEYDVPANATLNINNKGAKPIYNEGSAIEADVIKAGKTVMFAYDGTNYVVTSLGGGGSNSEFVGIKLTEPDGEVAGLIGTTITITNEDTSETILSTTWQGDIVVAEIADGIEYTVTVGNAIGYYLYNNSETHTAVGGFSLNLTFEYIIINKPVDLDLPSGLKWASCNIGSTNPEDIGYYFSWGNIEGHDLGAPATKDYNFASSDYTGTPGASLTGNIPVNATYDAARANMGYPWRMPTKDEVLELIDNTDFIRFTKNEKLYVKVTSKVNQNKYIIFPVCGWIAGNYNYMNSLLFMHTSTYDSASNDYMYDSYDNLAHFKLAARARYVGTNIRAVQ